MSTNDSKDWQHAAARFPAESAEALSEYCLDHALQALFSAINLRDPLLAAHSLRVNKYCKLIADGLELNDNERKVLHYASLLHDCGKFFIPEAILWKNGALLPAEKMLVDQHPKATRELLQKLSYPPSLSQIPEVASSHHEALDGSGYPQGLAGDQIPKLSRIISVANVFDNLTSIKHFRDRTHPNKIDEQLQLQRNVTLDEGILDVFYSLPSDELIAVMNSERGRPELLDAATFKGMPWSKLIGLLEKPQPTLEEKFLIECFHKLYDTQAVTAGA